MAHDKISKETSKSLTDENDHADEHSEPSDQEAFELKLIFKTVARHGHGIDTVAEFLPTSLPSHPSRFELNLRGEVWVDEHGHVQRGKMNSTARRR